MGLRCGSSEFAYAILSGTKDVPIVEKSERICFPDGYSKAHSLKWFYQELSDKVTLAAPRAITLKGAEALANRNAAFVERIEYETIAFLVAADHGIKRVSKKVKSTIAKNMGFKGKGKYLATKLDTSKIQDFDKMCVIVQEALLAAWSELN